MFNFDSNLPFLWYCIHVEQFSGGFFWLWNWKFTKLVSISPLVFPLSSGSQSSKPSNTWTLQNILICELFPLLDRTWFTFKVEVGSKSFSYTWETSLISYLYCSKTKRKKKFLIYQISDIFEQQQQHKKPVRTTKSFYKTNFSALLIFTWYDKKRIKNDK